MINYKVILIYGNNCTFPMMVLKALCGVFMVRAIDATENSERDPTGKFYSQERRK